MDFLWLTQQFLERDKPYSDDQIVEHITQLRAVLRYHSHQYYNDAPVISDGEYDKLFSLLISREERIPALITENSPSQLVWASPVGGFVKKKHRVQLLSLQNTYNSEEVVQWHESIERMLLKEWTTDWWYCVEAKLDGSSAELIYEYGKLTGGITRGDGKTWEDISDHVQCIQNLPHFVAARKAIAAVHLRGEVVMSNEAFAMTNHFQIEHWLTPFANPRNAAAGTLRQLDTSLTQKRWLTCFVYDLLWSSDMRIFPSDHAHLLHYFADLSIPVFHWWKQCRTVKQVQKICEDESIQDKTQNGSIWCDGLVIKINEFSVRDLLGATHHHPRWAIAFKYPTQEVAAHLRDILFQVGRTWVITPLAQLDPVVLWWVTVGKATLHNMDFIIDRDIRKGDRVWIKRSGEVIPYVLWPIIQRRAWDVEQFAIPKNCPVCETQLHNDDSMVAVYCPNSGCQWRKIAQLRHFVGKQSMNIQGLWDALIEQLVAADILSAVQDLYKMVEKEQWPYSKQLLHSLPGMWWKKTTALYKELQLTKNSELRRVIHGLGIRWVGKKIAQSVQAYLQDTYQWGEITVDWLVWTLNEEALQNIYGVGNKVATDIAVFLQDTVNKGIIRDLIKYGVINQEQFAKQGDHQQHLAWMSIVLTWSLPFPRETITETLQQFGAIVPWSVSKQTDIVLAGEKAWGKVQKAEKLGVALLTREQFIDQYPFIGKSFSQEKTPNHPNPPIKSKEEQSEPQQRWLFG